MLLTAVRDVLGVDRLGTLGSVRLVDGSAEAVPRQVPDCWRRGEEVRDQFRRLVPISMHERDGARVLGVCSTSAGEGTSWVVSGLACALAESGHRVIVVDAHRTRPAQAGIFDARADANNQPHDSDRAESVLGHIGVVAPTQLEDAEPHAMLRRLLTDVRAHADVVVVDLECLRESSQVLNLRGSLDRLLLVVESERDRREVVGRSLEALARAGHHVAGAVLNKRVRRIPNFLYQWL